MTKKTYREIGWPDADEFLQGKHPKILSPTEAQKLSTEPVILSSPKFDPDSVRPINSVPESSGDYPIKKETIDPIRPAKFQRPDYFHLQVGQAIYIDRLSKGLKTKAFLKNYNSATRTCEIWLADESGEIDYKITKRVHQNLVFIKVE